MESLLGGPQAFKKKKSILSLLNSFLKQKVVCGVYTPSDIFNPSERAWFVTFQNPAHPFVMLILNSSRIQSR